jgi:hypothetical protein
MNAADHNLIKTIFALGAGEELAVDFRRIDRDLLWQILETISGLVEPKFENRLVYCPGSNGTEFYLYITRIK